MSQRPNQPTLPGCEDAAERRPWRWRRLVDRDRADLAELRRLQEALGITREEVEALRRAAARP